MAYQPVKHLQSTSALELWDTVTMVSHNIQPTDQLQELLAPTVSRLTAAMLTRLFWLAGRPQVVPVFEGVEIKSHQLDSLSCRGTNFAGGRCPLLKRNFLGHSRLEQLILEELEQEIPLKRIHCQPCLQHALMFLSRPERIPFMRAPIGRLPASARTWPPLVA